MHNQPLKNAIFHPQMNTICPSPISAILNAEFRLF
nr:MAG TPA: hypothetical protein [Caudoviricetes sp.]